MVTSASKPLTFCCKALLKDMMVFSGASYKAGDKAASNKYEYKTLNIDVTEIFSV